LGLLAGVVCSMQQQIGRQSMKVANISQNALMPQKRPASWLLGLHDVYEALRLIGCYENWLRRRSGARLLCGVAKGLGSAAATGKPVAVSWVVVLGAGALGGVVAWKVAFLWITPSRGRRWVLLSARAGGDECLSPCRPR
jgi:hypothetical protein